MTGASQYRLKGQHADTSETRKPTLVEQGAVTPKKIFMRCSICTCSLAALDHTNSFLSSVAVRVRYPCNRALYSQLNGLQVCPAAAAGSPIPLYAQDENIRLHYTWLCSLQIEYNKISHFYFKETVQTSVQN